MIKIFKLRVLTEKEYDSLVSKIPMGEVSEATIDIDGYHTTIKLYPSHPNFKSFVRDVNKSKMLSNIKLNKKYKFGRRKK